MTSKERIYATLAGERPDRIAVTPIFMAWAAHFAGHTYRDYYLDGDILVKSQLAVVREFNLDQISAISDPWREAAGYGMEFEYPPEGVGKPKDILIKSSDDVRKIGRLDVMDCERTAQRVESIAAMAKEVGETHSVLGWVEGPLAEYADLRGVENALIDLMERPGMFLDAARLLVDNAIEFAVEQIKAGADMIGIGDAAASLVGPTLYEQFVLPFEQKLISAIHDAGSTVKLHICGNTSGIVGYMGQTGADVIDLDWMVDLEFAREAVGDDVVLCGNFDPAGVLLEGTPREVASAARECIRKGGDRFILMPGCEVPPRTTHENLRAFCPGEECLIYNNLLRS